MVLRKVSTLFLVKVNQMIFMVGLTYTPVNCTIVIFVEPFKTNPPKSGHKNYLAAPPLWGLKFVTVSPF